MQFLFQPLTWGFLLVGIPILVHLINMLRHRRQKWAAMEFLLDSYRRNRRWVMLKQWLLLLSRIVAMLLLVFMLAKWVSGSQWLSWIGGQTTHHYVLLDDSYSMAELSDGESAFQRAKKALSGLVTSISQSPGQHQVTLLRWSRAALALQNESETARLDTAADLFAQSVPRDPDRLLDRIQASEPSALQLGPLQSLELISPLISENAEQQNEVYIISDLRRNEFGEPKDLRNRLQQLVQNSAELHLIHCSKTPTENLTLVSLEPEKEVWAVGVPLLVRLQVRNRTERTQKNVVVRVRSITYGNGVSIPQSNAPFSGEISDLPPIAIEEIGPGETVSRQVQVVFGMPGSHVIEASLEDDSLAQDNRRWCALEIKANQKVLLIDDDVEQKNAFFLQTVVNPDPRLSTGMEVEIADSVYLRDTTPAFLSDFDVIVLLDVGRLDAQSVSALESYCAAGGGILYIPGANTNVELVNSQLYKSGQGLFPTMVSGIREIFDAGLEMPSARITPADHRIWGPLLKLDNSPFGLIRISRLLETAEDSNLAPGTEIVATAFDNAPLLLDRAYGDGRFLALMTGLSPEWSTWTRDPTFVIFTLRSLGYLASFQRADTSRSTGTPIDLTFEENSVLPEAEVLVPARDAGMRVRIQKQVETSSEGVASLKIAPNLDSMDRDIVDSLLRAGIFEIWTLSPDGKQQVRNFAHNVTATEGDLTQLSPSEFTESLRGLEIDVQSADSVSSAARQNQGSQSTLLLCLLALLMLGEQMLAYSASYHAPVLGAR